MQSVGRQRPLGITIIAIILAIWGILALLGGILVLVGAGILGAKGVLDALLVVTAIIGIILGVADLVLAWGLWTLKPWAFWATVIIEALHIVNALIPVLSQHTNIGSALIGVIIPIIILIYLFADSNVRAAFRT